MKNVLLLFVFAFTLCWVGCEKEEINIPESINEGIASDNSIYFDSPSKDIQARFAEESDDELCCDLFSDLITSENQFNGDIKITVYFIPPTPSAIGDASIFLRYFINGFYHGQNTASIPQDFICDSEGAKPITREISKDDFNGCPYNVRVEATLFERNEQNQLVQCDRMIYEESVEYLFDNDFACEQGVGPCFDQAGNPIIC